MCVYVCVCRHPVAVFVVRDFLCVRIFAYKPDTSCCLSNYARFALLLAAVVTLFLSRALVCGSICRCYSTQVQLTREHRMKKKKKSVGCRMRWYLTRSVLVLIAPNNMSWGQGHLSGKVLELASVAVSRVTKPKEKKAAQINSIQEE